MSRVNAKAIFRDRTETEQGTQFSAEPLHDLIDNVYDNLAPSGFGLGSGARQVTDLNTAVQSGFYTLLDNPTNAYPNAQSGDGGIVMAFGNGNTLVQVFWRRGANQMWSRRRHTSGTIWEDWVGDIRTVIDMNNEQKNGFVTINNNTPNVPFTNQGWGLVSVFGNGGGSTWQLVMCFATRDLWFRSSGGNNWEAWRRIPREPARVVTMISSSGWAGTAGNRTQTINFAGVTTTDLVTVAPGITNQTVADHWNRIHRAVVNNGSITFTCFGDIPTMNIDITLTRQRTV
jgi:hypothetical protein